MPRPIGLSDIPFMPSDTLLLDQVKLDNPMVIIDLGSGDGTILKWFKEQYPDARVIGYELDESRAVQSQLALPDAEIVHGDMWDAEVSDADVVYIYWLESIMPGFLEVFWPQLKPGAVVISRHFTIPGLTTSSDIGEWMVYTKP